MAHVDREAIALALDCWHNAPDNRCPNCRSAIPNGYWDTLIDRTNVSLNGATGRMHCPHCDTVATVAVMLLGRYWDPIGPIKTIVAPSAKIAIIRALEKKRGGIVLDKSRDLRRVEAVA